MLRHLGEFGEASGHNGPPRVVSVRDELGGKLLGCRRTTPGLSNDPPQKRLRQGLDGVLNVLHFLDLFKVFALFYAQGLSSPHSAPPRRTDGGRVPP